MIMLLRHSLLLVPVLLFSVLGCLAQSSKNGPKLTWTRSIEVGKGEVVSGERKFPAHVITVFEADGPVAIELWEKDLGPLAKEITGKRPYRAVGVRLPALGEAPLTILATATSDKKNGNAMLSLAYLQNDSTVHADNGAQEKVSRDLAIRLNQALVQTQIDAAQKELAETMEDLTDEQEDHARSQERMSDANTDLEKNANRQSKLQRDIANLQGEISGLERRFAMSNDPKDLKKLTSARKKLAKEEKELSGLMADESKAKGKANKYQEDMTSHSEVSDEHSKSKEELEAMIAELKRKKDAIR